MSLEITDLEIVLLIHKKPAERLKSAQHAWMTTKLYPEYKYVVFLIDENGTPVMTDEQIKKVANDHRKKKKISFANRIAMQKIGAERAMQVDWVITVKKPSKKKRLSVRHAIFLTPTEVIATGMNKSLNTTIWLFKQGFRTFSSTSQTTFIQWLKETLY
jgi:hypothetical protein